LRYPANWRLHGKRAEGIRNAFMLADSRPDMVLALPGGEDTRMLVMATMARGLAVLDHRAMRLTGEERCPVPCRSIPSPSRPD
jgi:hypothetical protein